MRREDDFHQPSQLRRFELVVEGRSIFVNAHFLAEISPYFHRLCFGEGFREAREGRVEIADELFDEVVELLDFLLPDHRYMLRQRINQDNFALLAHFSHRMQLPNLKERLEEFVESELNRGDYRISAEFLVEMIMEAFLAGFRSSTISIMCAKLAVIGADRIMQLVKDLPDEFANRIIAETLPKRSSDLPMREQQRRPYTSSYDWNDFERRLFF